MRASLLKFNKANKKQREAEAESRAGSPRSKSSASSQKRMADEDIQPGPDNAKRQKANNDPPSSPKYQVKGKDPVSPVLVGAPPSDLAKEDGAPAPGDSLPVPKPAPPPNTPIAEKPEEEHVEGDKKELKSDKEEVLIPRT